jgi:hypothetical protein
MPDTALASRQAKRRVTRFYDQFQASVGLRTTQFSILPRAINVPGLVADHEVYDLDS